MENQYFIIRGKLLQKGFTLSDAARHCKQSRQLVRYAIATGKGSRGRTREIRNAIALIIGEDANKLWQTHRRQAP
jgi:hypothetical protein